MISNKQYQERYKLPPQDPSESDDAFQERVFVALRAAKADKSPYTASELWPGDSISQAEREAVLRAVDAAEHWGYGNIIAHLKRQWAEALIANYRDVSPESALQDVDRGSAYPLRPIPRKPNET